MVVTTLAPRALACPARVAGLGATGFLPARPASSASPRRGSGVSHRRAGETLVVRAQEGGGGDSDLDAVLMKFADKFEKLDNKPVVIGYGVGAFLAFLFVEWLIHLPVLDILLGFPAQLLGVLLGPVLLIRYLVDKEDFAADLEATLGKVTGLLPGMK